MTKILLLLLLMCSALFSAGCVDEQLTAEEIAEQMQQKSENIEDYSYTMYITSSLDGEDYVLESEMLFKEPRKMKSVVIQPAEEAGSLTVSDGETIWTYIPNENTVMQIEMPDISEDAQMDYVGMIGGILNESDISFLGIDEFDSRTVYVIRMMPKEETETPFFGSNVKAWIDKETWMPLKYEMYDEDENPMISFEIRNLKVNTGISDDEFEFKIPEGAEVEVIDPIDMNEIAAPEEVTLEEAEDTAGFDLLLPSYIPEGYEFDCALIFNNSATFEEDVFEKVILVYNKGDDWIRISEVVYETGSSDISDLDDAETVGINGSEGKFVAFVQTNLLRWTTGDIELSILGMEDKDEIVKVAESMV
ncbi:outer membrane lipoprotein-sorting protein [Methanococcoides sp. AM1]|uniref:outer membrane lipoprotein-sorting protein n=1 Tax=Methanococcoides sp. AM1 TaxID=1201011 RepID=UPI0014384D60|nr:outer membrane lipoprotein-sorting protein [Methanococcoides sp. AM1]